MLKFKSQFEEIFPSFATTYLLNIAYQMNTKLALRHALKLNLKVGIRWPFSLGLHLAEKVKYFSFTTIKRWHLFRTTNDNDFDFVSTICV